MSEQLAGVARRSVRAARDDFLDRLQMLCEHTWTHALRKDIGPRELLYRAGLFASRECDLAGRPSNGPAIAIRVVLDVLRL